MKAKTRYRCILAGGIAVCFAVTAMSLMLGNIRFSFADIINILTGSEGSAARYILIYSRIPRTLACLLAGSALSVSGAVLQNVLSNKLASPGIIGVNAGAGLGVTVCCACGIFSGAAVSAAAFSASLITVLAISVFARSASASKTTVILGGVALNSILGAISESVSVLTPDAAMLTTEFRVGGFSSISYTRLLPASVMIITALILLFSLSNELDVISLGDETAQSVGLSVKKYRILFLILSALLAGAAVSFAGLLGFIGLIIPHLVRKLVGGESRKLLPLCSVIGAGFVCMCDLAARLLFAPYELPVGIIMSIVGGPVFVILLIHLRGGHRHA